MVAQLIFWGALSLIGYTYGGYLLVLVALDAWKSLRANARYLAGKEERRRLAAVGELPKVSVLVAAYNEKSCIREKIENTLAFDYPLDRLEILIGSDGSTDGTDDIVREYEARGVRLSAAPRGGKVSVLNRLSRQATGELWLFTDANTMIAPDAVRQMVRRFSDPLVGGVCGRLQLVAPGGAAQAEGAYWKYENLLKFYESKQGALMGANGGLYMLRRSLWQPLPADTIVDDFLVTMRVVARGRRLVYAPDAVATEETAADLEGEFKRRVRISAGNFQSLRELSPLLVQTSFAGFALWSHKVLRWIVPVLLAFALLANLSLAARPFYLLTLLGQVGLYALALLARAGKAGPLARVGLVARYFVEMNAALFLGLWRHLRGTQSVRWDRTARPAQKQAA